MLGSRLFASLLGFLLLGYAFLDRGFAYLGVAPFYVGELVLGVGLLVFCLGGISTAFLRSPISWALLAFIAWSALIAATGRPITFDGTLRHSVIWGYALFAFLTAGVILRLRNLEDCIGLYGRWMPLFLIWAPVAFATLSVLRGSIPMITGPDDDFKPLKAGDFGVHLAGATAFIALGLYAAFPGRSSWLPRFRESVLWACLSVGLVVIGTQNRGGLLSIIVVIATILVLRPASRITKFVVTAVLILLLAAVFGAEVELERRTISVAQLFENLRSMVGLGPQVLSETVNWRIEWWKAIIDYTVFGDHFWAGKGYEINLAVSDGFAGSTDNRSPHNGHLSVLARSGVPGLFLWCCLLGTVFVALLSRYRKAKVAGLALMANANLWILTYLLAASVNMSFDVYLEGPQGGIWFWCLIGLATAFCLIQDEFHAAQQAPAAEAEVPTSLMAKP